jgi:hypothetical protein
MGRAEFEGVIAVRPRRARREGNLNTRSGAGAPARLGGARPGPGPLREAQRRTVTFKLSDP